MHELATNAMKYGAPGLPGGRVELRWRLEDARLVVDWRERCPGRAIARATRRGFGTELLEQTIEHQLDGAVTLDWRPDGLRCTIAVPLAPTT